MPVCSFATLATWPGCRAVIGLDPSRRSG
jgi:hypothetical protein